MQNISRLEPVVDRSIWGATLCWRGGAAFVLRALNILAVYRQRYGLARGGATQPNWSFAFRVAAARTRRGQDFDASYLLIETTAYAAPSVNYAPGLPLQKSHRANEQNPSRSRLSPRPDMTLRQEC